MDRLDYYDIVPKGMDAYLSHHGWHFSKSMCEWAVKMMRTRDGGRVTMRTKEQVEQMLRNNGVEIQNNKGYDIVYVTHMAYSDFYGSSLRDEASVARYVKDYLDDVDGYDGIAFTRFMSDCIATGTPVDWEDMI